MHAEATVALQPGSPETALILVRGDVAMPLIPHKALIIACTFYVLLNNNEASFFILTQDGAWSAARSVS
jgi:hypothetical protein